MPSPKDMFYSSGEFSDVSLLLTSPQSSETLSLHKVILAAHSSLLLSYFRNESHEPLVVPCIHSAKIVLKYCYSPNDLLLPLKDYPLLRKTADCLGVDTFITQLDALALQYGTGDLNQFIESAIQYSLPSLCFCEVVDTLLVNHSSSKRYRIIRESLPQHADFHYLFSEWDCHLFDTDTLKLAYEDGWVPRDTVLKILLARLDSKCQDGLDESTIIAPCPTMPGGLPKYKKHVPSVTHLWQSVTKLFHTETVSQVMTHEQASVQYLMEQPKEAILDGLDDSLEVSIAPLPLNLTFLEEEENLPPQPPPKMTGPRPNVFEMKPLENDFSKHQFTAFFQQGLSTLKLQRVVHRVRHSVKFPKK